MPGSSPRKNVMASERDFSKSGLCWTFSFRDQKAGSGCRLHVPNPAPCADLVKAAGGDGPNGGRVHWGGIGAWTVMMGLRGRSRRANVTQHPWAADITMLLTDERMTDLRDRRHLPGPSQRKPAFS